jgi:hypothetical protein
MLLCRYLHTKNNRNTDSFLALYKSCDRLIIPCSFQNIRRDLIGSEYLLLFVEIIRSQPALRFKITLQKFWNF